LKQVLAHNDTKIKSIIDDELYKIKQKAERDLFDKELEPKLDEVYQISRMIYKFALNQNIYDQIKLLQKQLNSGREKIILDKIESLIQQIRERKQILQTTTYHTDHTADSTQFLNYTNDEELEKQIDIGSTYITDDKFEELVQEENEVNELIQERLYEYLRKHNVPKLIEMRKKESTIHDLFTIAEREEEKASKLELQLYDDFKSKIDDSEKLRKKINDLLQTVGKAGNLRREAILAKQKYNGKTPTEYDQLMGMYDEKITKKNKGRIDKLIGLLNNYRLGTENVTNISINHLTRIIRNKNTSTASELLLLSLWDKSNLKHRIYTACMLYFVTTADVSCMKEFNFLHPLSNIRDKEKLKHQATNIINMYAQKNNNYMDKDEGRLYTFLPSLKLYWHEIFHGILLRSLLNCLDKQNSEKMHDALHATKHDYSVETYTKHVVEYVITNKIKCANRSVNFDALTQPLNRRPIDEKDYVVIIADYHGEICNDHALVKVPSEVLMVKVGIISRVTVMDKKTQYRCKDPKLITDVEKNGAEYISPGTYYPEISLGHIKMFRCDTKENLDPTKKLSLCSEVLEVAQTAVSKSGHYALLFLTACQTINSSIRLITTEPEDKRTIALSSTIPTIHRGPKKITIIDFGNQKIEFDITEAINRSLKQRQKSNKVDKRYRKSMNKVLDETEEVYGGGRHSRLWIVTGLIATIASTIVTQLLQA
jgi:hypothetical protein